MSRNHPPVGEVNVTKSSRRGTVRAHADEPLRGMFSFCLHGWQRHESLVTKINWWKHRLCTHWNIIHCLVWHTNLYL